jgi:hypothetical protein
MRALPSPALDENRSAMELGVTELIETHPQVVADVMQAWIKEDN